METWSGRVSQRVAWLVALIALGVLIGATALAAAATTPTDFAQGTAYTQAPAGAAPGQPYGLGPISCASPGDCTAVGSYVDAPPAPGTGHIIGDTEPMAATETNGVWGAPTEITLPSTNGSPNQDASLTGVSCLSPGNCTAIGDFIDSSGDELPFAATETSGAWTTQALVLPNNARAEAVGAVLTYGISCTPGGNCTAVGFYATTTPKGSGPGVVSFAVSETAGTWGQATEVTPADGPTTSGLTGISCPSAGNCQAIGTETTTTQDAPIEATETQGSWSTSTPVSFTTAPVAASDITLNSISCPSMSSCQAVGDSGQETAAGQALVASDANGTWSAQTISAPSNANEAGAEAELNSLSCPQAGDCVAVGGYADTNATTSSFDGTSSETQDAAASATEVGGVWTTDLTEVALPGDADTSGGSTAGLGSVSCWASQACSATGSYVNTSQSSVTFTTQSTAPTSAPTTTTTATAPPVTTTTQTSAPTPKTVPAPALKRLIAAASSASATLSCAAGATAACTGTISGTVLDRARHDSTITVGRISYSVQPGHSTTVTLKLSSTAKALLKRFHKLLVTVEIVPSGSSSATSIHKLTFTHHPSKH